MLTEDERSRLRAFFPKAPGADRRLTLRDAERIAAETGMSLRKVEYFALQEGTVPERYDRNIGTLGPDGQRDLLAACVAVVGLGGLGGHVVETLARLGVGRIVGIDSDVFAESNLNRQLLSRRDNLGDSKAEAAARRVARINPAVEFVGHAVPFENLGHECWRGSGVVFDCLDGIPARRVLAERCASAGVVLVHGAIAGWCGQVGLCPPGGDLIGNLYAGEKRGAEQRMGNLPFTAAVAANLMVAEAVPVLLGRPVPSREQLRFFDLLAGEWETIEF